MAATTRETGLAAALLIGLYRVSDRVITPDLPRNGANLESPH